MADYEFGQRAEFMNDAERKPDGFLSEIWDFLRFNKKWWLAPIVTVLVTLGLIIALGGTAASPFIYTLF